MGCTYRSSEVGLTQLMGDPGMERQVESSAKAIARAAASVAPRRTGRLAKSYRATKAEMTPQGDVAARAYTAVPYGHIIEWGSSQHPPKAPLRRGAQRAGYRLRIAAKGQ